MVDGVDDAAVGVALYTADGIAAYDDMHVAVPVYAGVHAGGVAYVDIAA